MQWFAKIVISFTSQEMTGLSIRRQTLFEKSSFTTNTKFARWSSPLDTELPTCWFWTLQTISINAYIRNTWSYFTARPLEGRLGVRTVSWFRVKWTNFTIGAGGRLPSNFTELQSYRLFITHTCSFRQYTYVSILLTDQNSKQAFGVVHATENLRVSFRGIRTAGSTRFT